MLSSGDLTSRRPWQSVVAVPSAQQKDRGRLIRPHALVGFESQGSLPHTRATQLFLRRGGGSQAERSRHVTFLARASRSEADVTSAEVDAKGRPATGFDSRDGSANGATREAHNDGQEAEGDGYDCVGTGLRVECVIHTDAASSEPRQSQGNGSLKSSLLPEQKSGNLGQEEETDPSDLDCVGTGTKVECISAEELDAGDLLGSSELGAARNGSLLAAEGEEKGLESVRSNDWVSSLLESALLISPFFFWGSAMVAMKVRK